MKIAKTRNVKTPQRGTSLSAGIDFFVPEEFVFGNLFPNKAVKIPSGIKVEIPKGHVLIGFNKSGIALKGLQIGACVIDEDYQGEIHLHLFNVSHEPILIEPGMKIAQFILLPVNYNDIELVKEKDIHKVETERGSGGFGSTNKNE